MVGLVLIAIGLGALAHAFHQARDRSPRLVIDRAGVWFKEWELPVLPWDQVFDVYQKGIKLRPYVIVLLRDQNQYFASLPPRERQRVKFSRLIKPGLLLIPAGAVEATLPEIETAIKRGRERFAS